MNEQLRSKLISEFLWFIGLLSISAAIEYIAISVFDLHPMLGVKIQGIIGLTIIGYGIRLVARVIGETRKTSQDKDADKANQDSTRS